MTTKDVFFESIDHFLGAGEKRFFSGGFRRVLHTVQDIQVAQQEDGRGFVQAIASVMYPSNWSKKKETDELRPHLSSIDAVVLSVQLSEMFLTHSYGLTDQQRRNMWLRRYVMKAGAIPQEDLAEFAIHARHLETRAVPDSLCGHISIFDCQVGTIKVRCEIEHGMGEVNAEDGFYRTVEDILGAAERQYYGEGYKFPTQTITNVGLDLEQQSATATLKVGLTDEESLIDEGLEAQYRPSVSMIDAMTSIAQVAQVLLYRHDNIDRSKSNTLWMREVIMESHSPIQPVQNEFTISTSIAKSRLLKVRGNVWRSSEMVGDCQGIHVTYSIAHELPASVVAENESQLQAKR